MGDVKGFLKFSRQKTMYRPVEERKGDYKEVFTLRPVDVTEEQAARCMDCGTPFCHNNCPLGNIIPEWNDATFDGEWEEAFKLLDSTNNLPEMTGRVCPALCEAGCVLSVNDDSVTIRENELGIIERAWEEGYIKPCPPEKRTGKKVAVVGSGPAGIAAADQMNQAGHSVTLFERDEKPGGIMRFGIPDFKLDKSAIDRRIALLEEEGVVVKCGVNVGVDLSTDELLNEFDAVILTGGSRSPRDLPIEGRDLKGVYFAMEYLMQSNRRVSGLEIPEEAIIDAKGKNVVVIGGGDTGNDCVGTAIRQGAVNVMQIELFPAAPKERDDSQPWPVYPRLFKTVSSHEEGGERDWEVATKRFVGEDGVLKGLECERVNWEFKPGCRPEMRKCDGSDFELKADLVVLAMGFVSPEHAGLLDNLGIEYTDRGNVKTNEKYQTSIEKVFAAGDMRRGQSLVVWAISEGRNAAHYADEFLMGTSVLPKRDIPM